MKFSIDRRRFITFALSLGATACTNQKNEDSSSQPSISVLDGYSDKQSYLPGEDISLFLNCSADGAMRFRLYDVLGQEVFSVPIVVSPQKINNAQPWQDGFGYSLSAKFSVPDIKSGIYFWDGKIRCIIKPNSLNVPKILIVYPTNTENAYNPTGGKCMYVPNPGYANTLSFLRSSDNNNYIKFNSGFYIWLKSQPLYDSDCGHIADCDLENLSTITSAKLLILTGHSEYWTRAARLNFDQYINQGGHSLILSGNTMWWQMRYSTDGTQMICYKYDSASDPVTDPNLITTLWRNTKYPTLLSIGADFFYGGYGNNPNGWHGMKIVAYQSPIFTGTSLLNGEILLFETHEYDSTPIAGYTPNGEPIIDTMKLNFYRANLLGFNFCTDYAGKQTVATWFTFQKSTTSGIVINGASTNWCSSNTIEGVDGYKIKRVIANSIDLLLSGTYPI